MRLRIRKVSREERMSNPDKDYLVIKPGAEVSGTVAGILEVWGDGHGCDCDACCNWTEVEIVSE